MAKKNKVAKFLDLEIESIGLEGVAIAKLDGKVYFVKNAAPGDKVKAQIFKEKKSFAEAKVVEIYTPSSSRVDAKCSHFGVCGGCSWQHLDYTQQTYWKKINTRDAIERIAKVPYKKLNETMEAPKTFYYRNKMEFSFASSRWLTDDEIANSEDIDDRNFAFGLHIPGRFDKVLDLKHCYIQPEEGNDIMLRIRNKAKELGLSAYNPRENSGFLRSLYIRKSIKYNELMLILVTNDVIDEQQRVFINWFAAEFTEVKELIHSINNSQSPVRISSSTNLKGDNYITENILGIDYRISPFSFFQTNPYQLDNFIAKIIEMAELKSSDIVWDLYCGTGSITLPASKHCEKIYGVELVESSILDAKANAKLNKIENSEFFCSDLHAKTTPELLAKLPKPDCIIVDPPRAGMHANLVEHILQIAPERIVYVSCNPATQARDLAILDAKYYIDTVQPVDMFPHTYHVESIVNLKKK